GRNRGCLTEQLHRFLFRVGLFAFERLGPFHILHVDRDFHLHYVDAIAVFGELAHTFDDRLRFLLREVEALLVHAFFVSNELQEERDVIGAAFVAQPLDPSVLLVVSFFWIKRRVVEQNLDAIRARLFQAAHRPMIQQVAQASGSGLVVAGLFIRQQQAGILRAPLRSRQSPLGIEQDGAGMGRQHLAHQYLEFFHHFIGDGRALFLGKRLLQRAALVHGSGGDYATFIRYSVHSSKFARGKLHRSS